MNKIKEQIDKSHAMAREWFKTHIATVKQEDAHAVIIEWSRPDTSNYWMRFIIVDSTLIVIGDVGDAIYRFWYSPLADKVKFQNYDWHYCVGKCVASETGRSYTMKVPGIKEPVPNIRAIAHFVGLKMALAQLDAKKADKEAKKEL